MTFKKISALGNFPAVQLCSILLMGLLFITIKLDGVSLDQTLWAEDGPIFISQARDYGLATLLIPYNGYYLLYPRLIAWLSCAFDLAATPKIFFVGWVFAFFSLIFTLFQKARQFTASYLEIAAVCLLAIALPHSCEVFFTLTNAQWMLGCSLTLLLLVPSNAPATTLEKIILGMACLTGPFTLVLVPLAIVQMSLLRDWPQRKNIYLWIAAGAILQISALVFSKRLSEGAMDKDLNHWGAALWHFFSFDASQPLILWVCATFWLVAVYGWGQQWHKLDLRNCNSPASISLLLCLAAALFFLAGLLAGKTAPQQLHPLGGGSRYFFIPYQLLLLSVWLVLLKQPRLKLLLMLAWSVLSYQGFTQLSRDDYHFQAYAQFAKQNPHVTLPINPQIEKATGWNIDFKRQLPDQIGASTHSFYLDTENVQLQQLKTFPGPFIAPTYFALNEQAAFILSSKQSCAQVQYLGFQAKIARYVGGWVDLSWSPTTEFSVQNTIRRYYPAGDVLVHFAFPAAGVRHLRFAPMSKKGPVQILEISIWCL